MRYLVNGKVVDSTEDDVDIVVDVNGTEHKLIQGLNGYEFRPDLKDLNFHYHSTIGEAVHDAKINGYSVFSVKYNINTLL